MIHPLAYRYAQAYLKTQRISHQLLHCFIIVRDALKKQKDAKVYIGMMERFGLDPRPVMYTFFEQFGCQAHEIKPLFDLLFEQKRFILLLDILSAIITESQKRKGIIKCTVSSSIQLTDAEKKEIETFIHTHVSKNALIEYAIDASLIAGIRIVTNTKMWEHSIAQQLRNLSLWVEETAWK